MKAWTRARRPCRCGLCGELLALGAPVLELRIAALRSARLRCPACARCEPPPDLPLDDAPPRPAPLTGVMARLGLLPLDEAARREPGEEG